MTRVLAVSVVIVALGLLPASGIALAQLPAQPDSLVRKYRADYAVPDAPALTLLELDESDLVRPSTVRELAVALTDFTGSAGALQLPKTAAVEFSPALLFFGRGLKLQEYQKLAPLYRLRVSVASRLWNDGGSLTSIAFGLRTSLIDAADLRDRSTNPAFFEEAERILARAQQIDAAAEDAAEVGGIHAPVVYTRSQQRELDQLTTQFGELNASVADTAWNRSVLDIAVGLRADAADSTGRNLSVQQLAAWLTYGGGVGNWAQWVVGAKMASDRDSVTRNFELAGSAAARFYAGTNRYKVYVDLQASKRAAEDAAIVFGGGVEVNVSSGLWLVLAVGSQPSDRTSGEGLKAQFAFKSGFPMR